MAKKFTIIKLSEPNTTTSVNISPISNGKFKTFIATRPKKCPLCNTENMITKVNAHWKCKKCEHTWL